MSNIPERQNDEQLLRYLAAQRQLYTEDKRWGYGWLIAVAVVTALGTLLQILLPQMTALANFGVLLAAIIGVIVSTYSQHRIEAAAVQEIFDSTLFELDWNKTLAEKPDETLVARAVERFRGRKEWAQASALLRNWYENSYVKNEPLVKARIACQMENIGYSHRLRRLWAAWTIVAAVLLFALLLFIGLGAGWTLSLLFLGPMPLFAPLLLGALQNSAQHLQAANRLDRLSRVAQILWHDTQAGHVVEPVLTQRARELQDEIYHMRRTYLPVPDWWYRLLRKLNPPPPPVQKTGSTPTAQQ